MSTTLQFQVIDTNVNTIIQIIINCLLINTEYLNIQKITKDLKPLVSDYLQLPPLETDAPRYEQDPTPQNTLIKKMIKQITCLDKCATDDLFDNILAELSRNNLY